MSERAIHTYGNIEENSECKSPEIRAFWVLRGQQRQQSSKHGVSEGTTMEEFSMALNKPTMKLNSLKKQSSKKKKTNKTVIFLFMYLQFEQGLAGMAYRCSMWHPLGHPFHDGSLTWLASRCWLSAQSSAGTIGRGLRSSPRRMFHSCWITAGMVAGFKEQMFQEA